MMNGYWHKSLTAVLVKYVAPIGLMILLAGCQSHPTDKGQQYKDGQLDQPFLRVDQPNASGKPINGQDYLNQLSEIRSASPSLYSRQSSTYQSVQNWLAAGADPRTLTQYGLTAYQMEGMDHYGNVQFTGYYTPVLQARTTPQGEFRYPLYGVPKKNRGRLPTRAAIYAGALDKYHVVLAYTNSLIDNFLMEVQGSGYIDLGDGSPRVFLGYGGKNGHPYRSIGKILIDRGESTKEEMSMQTIRHWAATHSEQEVRALLEQNPSFVFFKPEASAPVRGASAVPLVAKASVASDRSLVPAGTSLLAEVPLLDSNGKFTGNYEMRLMVALDVGGAIKGQHFDIYHGIGQEAGHEAGFYNHYGRVWVIKSAQSSASPFRGYGTTADTSGSTSFLSR